MSQTVAPARTEPCVPAAPQNKMGCTPICKLIFSMSLPMVISMLVQALYNVVDSIFVSLYSEEALSAVSYAFPAQNLMIGIAAGTAVGVNALLSRSLGSGDREKANRVAANGILLAGVGYLLSLLFAFFGTRTFLSFQTSTPAILLAGEEYLFICCAFSFGLFGQIIFERLMQSTGRTVPTMFTQGLGAILNIFLDPIFILPAGTKLLWFSMPIGLGMGAKGAAIATVTGQITAFLFAVCLNTFRNPDLKLRLRHFRPDGALIGRIYAVGIPSVLMVGIGSLMTTLLNRILNGFSDLAATTFGVYFKLQSFVFMPLFGMNNGVIPIVAYNYGAGRRDRIMQAFRISCITACSFMVIGFAVMQIFPAQLLSLFHATEDMLVIGIPALRTISYSFFFAGGCIAMISFFQALGKGIYAMLISAARQLAVLLPTAYLLSRTGVLRYVWFAFPIAELVSVAVSAGFFLHVCRTVLNGVRPMNAPTGSAPDITERS